MKPCLTCSGGVRPDEMSGVIGPGLVSSASGAAFGPQGSGTTPAPSAPSLPTGTEQQASDTGKTLLLGLAGALALNLFGVQSRTIIYVGVGVAAVAAYQQYKKATRGR